MTRGLDITLPQSWNWSPLKRATTFLNRGSAPDYVDIGPVRAVGQAANQTAGLDWERTRFHRYSGDARQLRGYLVPGDVLINSTGTGTLGRVGYFAGGPDARPCVADGHVTVARADPQVVDSRYLYYWLSSRPFYDYTYSALIVGATNQIELNREKLADAPVGAPEIEEQRRIADFLDGESTRIDSMIETLQRLLHALDERSSCRFRTAVAEAGGPRLADLDVGSDSPDGWRSVRLSKLLSKLTNGYVGPTRDILVDGPGVPYIQSLHIKGGVIDFERRRYFVEESWAAAHPRITLQAGDLLIVQTGAVGEVAVVDERFAGASCHALLIARTNPETITGAYLLQMLRSHFGRQLLSREQTGALHPHLEAGKVRDLVIPLPDLETQHLIVARCDESEAPLLQLQHTVYRQISLLSERRQALITAAITGRIDVPNARGTDS